MSTDLLRRAAKTLRDTATQAIHDGRAAWDLGRTKGLVSGKRIPVVIDSDERPSVVIEAFAERYEDVNAYVRLMHPPVALALAELLDEQARREDARVIAEMHVGLPDGAIRTRLDEVAEALAGAILREPAAARTDTPDQEAK